MAIGPVLHFNLARSSFTAIFSWPGRLASAAGSASNSARARPESTIESPGAASNTAMVTVCMPRLSAATRLAAGMEGKQAGGG